MTGRIVTIALAAMGAALVVGTASADTLTAVKVSTAPTLDGKADDGAWASAKAVDLTAVKGANFGGTGSTTGTIKAVHTGDTVYFLLQWKDATLNYQRSPYVKQADGSWKKLKDPDDKGGDNNKYYEDKAAMIWSVNDSIFGFEKRGCQMACHSGEPGKAYGNKYTEEKGEIGDIWHVKTVRTGPVGQLDDQWLDNTRFDAQKSPEAGRHSDPKTAGGYADVALKDGKPEFMSKDGKAANKGGTYWLGKADAVPFDDSRFQPGDEVASIMVSALEGDRGDIKAAYLWADGMWTVEFARKLKTGSEKDVQFDDLSKGYHFGVAFFDNAQVRHAYVEKPVELKFGM